MKPYKKEHFGVTKDGREVTRYTLENDAGMKLSVLDYGCRIQSTYVPDKNGNLINVTLGFTDMEKYEKGGCYGALIGRFANRIKNATFPLEGKQVKLTVNDHGNYIHGDYEHTIFEVEAHDNYLIFTHLDADGTFGFPGNVSVRAVYGFDETGTITLQYEALTDAPTVINITNHNYFNLDGLPENGREATPEKNNIFDQYLQIAAAEYLESDEVFMATGKVLPVEGDSHDFRFVKKITDELFDQNFCLEHEGILKDAAVMRSEKTGITMHVYTTQPGIQLYTGAKIAAALETQHYPDGPNHPDWPSSLLLPGQIYTEKTFYSFTTEEE